MVCVVLTFRKIIKVYISGNLICFFKNHKSYEYDYWLPIQTIDTQFLGGVWVYCPALNRPKRQPETHDRQKKIVLATFVIKIKIIFYPNDALNKNIQVIPASAHEL